MRGHDSSSYDAGKAGPAEVMSAVLMITSDSELDPEASEQLARQLRSEIAELDLDSVRALPAGTVPDGAKAADPVTLGAIVVSLSTAGGVLSSLVETLRDWLGRQSARHRISLTVDGDTIQLERATSDERRDLIAAYIRRHSGP
ncbi:effector-associated constant component EACC1 [Streptomyces sp. NPDC001415]